VLPKLVISDLCGSSYSCLLTWILGAFHICDAIISHWLNTIAGKFRGSRMNTSIINTAAFGTNVVLRYLHVLVTAGIETPSAHPRR
jgi:hypothetical protein